MEDLIYQTKHDSIFGHHEEVCQNNKILQSDEIRHDWYKIRGDINLLKLQLK